MPRSNNTLNVHFFLTSKLNLHEEYTNLPFLCKNNVSFEHKLKVYKDTLQHALLWSVSLCIRIKLVGVNVIMLTKFN